MPDQSNPGKIWLAPQCHEESPDGRHWCEDDVWGECEHCGGKPVEYVRADLAIPADHVLVPIDLFKRLLAHIEYDAAGAPSESTASDIADELRALLQS